MCVSGFARCEVPVATLRRKHGSPRPPARLSVFSGRVKACHCLHATAPQCGSDGDCDICLCCQECGPGAHLRCLTAGAGLSSLSLGSPSRILRLLRCHGPKAGLTTVNLGSIELIAKFGEPGNTHRRQAAERNPLKFPLYSCDT